jgi:hypothetical protein
MSAGATGEECVKKEVKKEQNEWAYSEEEIYYKERDIETGRQSSSERIGHHRSNRI